MGESCSGDEECVTGAACEAGQCACHTGVYTEVEATKLCSQCSHSRLLCHIQTYDLIR